MRAPLRPESAIKKYRVVMSTITEYFVQVEATDPSAARMIVAKGHGSAPIETGPARLTNINRWVVYGPDDNIV